MGDLRFIWDDRKAASNLRKHGVSFEEGETVFADEYGLLLDDPDHSEGEDRYLLLGLSDRIRLLVVSHTPGAHTDEIRLISARKATKSEQRQYVGRLRR